MKKTLFVLLLLFSTNNIYGQEKLKNLYILIEPTVVHNNKIDGYEVNPVLDISFNILDEIISWVTQNSVAKFRKVFIRGVGIDDDETFAQEFKNEKISFKRLKKYSNDLYNEMLGIKTYSVADTLSTIAKDIKKKKWKAKETLLIYIGDVTHNRNGFNSHGKALNSQWLINKRSPFVKSFIENDNTFAQGISVIVFNRTQLSLDKEKLREDFLINLFSLAGMKVYYVGEVYNNMETKLRSEDSYLNKVINQVRKKEKKMLDMRVMKDTQVCQYVGESEMTVPCGSY